MYRDILLPYHPDFDTMAPSTRRGTVEAAQGRGNPALALLENSIDGITLVSGDADLAGPVAAIRYRLGKPVAVYNPHDGISDELKRYASLYRNIPRDLPAACQLPDEVTLPNGRTIHRPEAWA